MDEQNHDLISVIIPTYNRAALLPKAVASVIAQDVDIPIEVIVVDDGSTDETEQLMSGDERVRYYRIPHGGACAARNKGIAEARGEYIAFLDSDDEWHTDYLSAQKRKLEQTGADVVGCSFMRHDESLGQSEVSPNEMVPEGWVDTRSLLKGNIISTQVIFGRSACIKQVLFDEQMPRMQDWDYVIQLSKRFRVYFSREVLAEVYVQSDSISKAPERAVRAMKRLLWKYREDYMSSEELLLQAVDSIARFELQAENEDLYRKKEEIERLNAELQRTEMERNYYQHRYQAFRNPVYGLKMLIRKKKGGR